MLYYIALQIIPYIGAFNVFTYLTVRTAGAAVTGFLFCLLIGPRIIERLRALKIGQFIKKDHVADLHKLHQSKAGTPTMGGTIMIAATVLALLLWSTLSNRLLLLAMLILVLLGAVGFMDDYIKLRRKHNDGLSARAKFMGQILAGLILGGYVIWNPVTPDAPYIRGKHIDTYEGLAKTLVQPENEPVAADDTAAVIWSRMSPELQAMLRKATRNGAIPELTRRQMIFELNEVLEHRDL
ncbi:MAG: hypothetical protein IT368_04795, partial [Candidatus Hydrogenedentes bacterium]|nr:hypothetical protein [Candidatus Hydrogenedentota bacterium]